MPAAYREHITKTFRDDAIRSVLLIDDEYSPYSELAHNQTLLLNELQKVSDLCETLANNSAPDEEKDKLAQAVEDLKTLTETSSDRFKRTMVAEQFVRFFHGQRCICDVEKQTQNLNPEKVRKSDLIILDYCLSGDDATKSLKLLRDLSHSKHLNLVVVYTNKPLDQVWIEIAATLRSSPSIEPGVFFDKESLAIWESSEDLFRDGWTELSRTQSVSFILGNESSVVEEVKEQFWSDIQLLDDFDEEGHSEPSEQIVRYLAELDVRKRNILADEEIKFDSVHGHDGLWIQSGEVFIALCEKHGGDEEEIAQQPSLVWNKLNEALHSWYPCFYRVVLSELQNRIEDSNLSMTKTLGKSEHEPIALLWSILKERPNKKLDVSENMLRYLLEDVSRELLHRDNKAVPNFIKEVANNVVEQPIEYVAFNSKKPEPHKGFLKRTIEVAKDNFKESVIPFDTSFCMNVAHALNERTTTLPDFPSYITTGMILKSEKSGKTRWFMCVTPSCDTVPTQLTGDNASQLNPHRLLTFAKLKDVSLEEALSKASQSSYVFISDGNNRMALNVVDPDSKQPDLVKFVIVNHNKSDLSPSGKQALKLKNQGEGIKTEQQIMIPVAQLDAHYAARYQAVQSHHEGRIGVDFVTADFSETVPS